MKSLALALLLAPLAQAADLAPFTSDGCSAFPDGPPSNASLWVECCIAHDLAYWQGGTEAERLVADQALEACVAGLGEPETGALMLAGVRMGGSPYIPTPYRWGYGWPFPRGYQPLGEAEKAQVRDRLRSLRLLIERQEAGVH